MSSTIEPASAEASVGATGDAPLRPLIVALGVVVIMVDGFDLQVIGFLAPEIARSWGLNVAAFGPVFSAGLFGSMIGAMAAGHFVRWTSLRAVMAGSLALFGACTLVTASAESLGVLTVLRFIVGLGLGAAVPVVVSIVTRNSPARFRATLIVLTLCGQPVGAIIGAALCARLIPIWGWPAGFYLAGLPPLLLIAPALALLRRNAQSMSVAEGSGDAEESGRWRQLFGGKLFATTLLLWACCFLAAFVIYIIVNWLPASVRADQRTLQQSLLAISMFNLGGIVGALSWAVLMDRYGPARVMVTAFAIAAIALAALDPLQPWFTVFLAAVFVCGFAAYGGAMTIAPLAILLYPPFLRTMAVGWVLGMGRLGATTGPLCASLALTAGLAVARLFYMAALAAALATVSLCFLARRHHRGEGMTWQSVSRP